MSHDDVTVEDVLIEDPGAAASLGFRGSSTVLIDGADIEPNSPTPVGSRSPVRRYSTTRPRSGCDSGSRGWRRPDLSGHAFTSEPSCPNTYGAHVHGFRRKRGVCFPVNARGIRETLRTVRP